MSLATLTPTEEECLARSRERNLAHARKAAALAAERRHRDASRRAWEQVRHLREAHGCTCALRPGMTVAELHTLGAGCTAPRWVCPVLDAYRRRLGA